MSAEFANKIPRYPLSRFWIGICLLCFVSTGCNPEAAPTGAVTSGDARVQIVSTVGMLADIIRQVGAEHVAIKTLMGPGTDPHLYRATARDRETLQNADYIFYCGHHLEGKLAETLSRISERVPSTAVCEQTDRSRWLADPDSSDAVDPHLWFDVDLWSECARVVSDALAKFDPAHASDYARNLDSTRARLAKLHQYVQQQVASIPQERRILVTAHDAFRYFGRAYGLEVLGIQGLSTESEPGVRRINELVELLVRQQVKAVFVESTVSEKNMRSLIEGCAARGHTLTIGGSLYSDAMGAADSEAATYEGMVRHNVDTLVKALR